MKEFRRLTFLSTKHYRASGDIYVLYRKERPDRRDRRRPRALKVPGACPVHGFALRAHSAHVTECACAENPMQQSNPGTLQHRSHHGMSLHLHTPDGAGADKVMPLDPTEVIGITQCCCGRVCHHPQGWRVNGARDAPSSHCPTCNRPTSRRARRLRSGQVHLQHFFDRVMSECSRLWFGTMTEPVCSGTVHFKLHRSRSALPF